MKLIFLILSSVICCFCQENILEICKFEDKLEKLKIINNVNGEERIQLSRRNPVYVKFDPYVQWIQNKKLFTLTIPRKPTTKPKFLELNLTGKIENPHYNTRHHDADKILISNENKIFTIWTRKWNEIRTLQKIHTITNNLKIIQIKTYIRRIYFVTCDRKEKDICSIKSMTQEGQREIILNPISIGKITSIGVHRNGLVFFSFKLNNENIIAYTDYKGSYVKYFSKFIDECDVNNIDIGIVKKENIITWSCGNMVYSKQFKGNENFSYKVNDFKIIYKDQRPNAQITSVSIVHQYNNMNGFYVFAIKI